MTQYRDINGLLASVNKRSPGAAVAPPRPGDRVEVVAPGTVLCEVLIHSVDGTGGLCRGELRGAVSDESGAALLGKGEPVAFDYKKIAGIHRR